MGTPLPALALVVCLLALEQPAFAAPAAPPAAAPRRLLAAGQEGGGTSDYNYAEPLSLSFLFYEAQRSGVLPAGGRVPWRGSAATADRVNGRDVSGGYFDAGDFVKFNLPQAFTIAVLSWSLVEFGKEGFGAAHADALAAVRWGADYLLSCDLGGGAGVVAQVGLGEEDHKLWRRPEDIREQRPVAVCDAKAPGSDVAAAMAAALAAASLAFGDADPAYSARLLESARSTYMFADQNRGSYIERCSPDARSFYPSRSYLDDLAWAAAWLHWATGEPRFLADAARHYADHTTKEAAAFKKYGTGFFWDSATTGAALLLSRKLGDAAYTQQLDRFVEAWTSYKGNQDVVFSPKWGFAWYTQDQGWGSLRHAANAAFVLLVYGKQLGAAGRTDARDRAVCFAHGQLRYALGETGQSYVVGFQKYAAASPQRVHHRGASCPPSPEPCDFRQFTAPGPNPRVIAGALVGGPDPSDIWRDDRTDARSNEVAIDYNGGFTGALAGLAVAPISYSQCVAKGLQRQKKG